MSYNSIAVVTRAPNQRFYPFPPTVSMNSYYTFRKRRVHSILYQLLPGFLYRLSTLSQSYWLHDSHRSRTLREFQDVLTRAGPFYISRAQPWLWNILSHLSEIPFCISERDRTGFGGRFKNPAVITSHQSLSPRKAAKRKGSVETRRNSAELCLIYYYYYQLMFSELRKFS